jgi:hypothetical protein
LFALLPKASGVTILIGFTLDAIQNNLSVSFQLRGSVPSMEAGKDCAEGGAKASIQKLARLGQHWFHQGPGKDGGEKSKSRKLEGARRIIQSEQSEQAERLQ